MYPKISVDEINAFFNDYYVGKYTGLRIGQAFYNTFYVRTNMPFPRLFYASNDESKYIIWNELAELEG